MERPSRFGLIGVGGIGRDHLAVLAKSEAQGRVKLVAVADPTLPRLALEKERLEGSGVRWYLDYREMLEGGLDLDAVIIATPIHLHLEMTLECLRQDLFVYLEKPPVPLVQQLETLIDADVHKRVAVGFQMITTPIVQAFKDLILSGELGEVHEFRASACWPRATAYYQRAPWAGRMAIDGKPVFDGPATNALAHLVHNVMYLASASPHGFDVPVEVQAELYRARPIESYDVAGLRGQFDSGARFTMAFTHATQQEQKYRLEARGSRGWARISDNGARLESPAGTREFDADFTSAMASVHDDFLDFLVGRHEYPATRLCDMRGFTRTTNGALLSSGGIHDISRSFQRMYGAGETTGYDVPGLTGTMDDIFAQGRLFSELGVRWAVQTAPVPVAGMKTIDFASYCPN